MELLVIFLLRVLSQFGPYILEILFHSAIDQNLIFGTLWVSLSNIEFIQLVEFIDVETRWFHRTAEILLFVYLESPLLLFDWLQSGSQIGILLIGFLLLHSETFVPHL